MTVKETPLKDHLTYRQLCSTVDDYWAERHRLFLSGSYGSDQTCRQLRDVANGQLAALTAAGYDETLIRTRLDWWL